MPVAPLRPCPVPGCPTIGPCAVHARRANADIRRWYATARWQRLRLDVLRAALQTCAHCGTVALALDVDHIDPHRGDPRRFWDRGNLQALCPACHTRKTDRENR